MSSGETRMTGYRPEVRTSYHTPSLVAGQIVDSEWRPISYKTGEGILGIPHGYFDKQLSEQGLLGYAAAEAIRWWFMAAAEAERPLGALYLETRLQSYSVVLTHKVTPKEVVGALDCRGKALPQAAAKEAIDE
jgi:hypothetical protein